MMALGPVLVIPILIAYFVFCIMFFTIVAWLGKWLYILIAIICGDKDVAHEFDCRKPEPWSWGKSLNSLNNGYDYRQEKTIRPFRTHNNRRGVYQQKTIQPVRTNKKFLLQTLKEAQEKTDE